MIDLTQIVKKEETKRDNYNFDTVPENAYTEDIKDEIEKELDTMNSKLTHLIIRLTNLIFYLVKRTYFKLFHKYLLCLIQVLKEQYQEVSL